MGGLREDHRAVKVAARILKAVAYGSARALLLLFATISSTSDKANAPLLPPDTKPWLRREDYRP